MFFPQPPRMDSRRPGKSPPNPGAAAWKSRPSRIMEEDIVTGRLILVRHGQSTWNLENLFTGWHDVDLSELGREEARLAGEELKREKLEPTIAFTSVLKRA